MSHRVLDHEEADALREERHSSGQYWIVVRNDYRDDRDRFLAIGRDPRFEVVVTLDDEVDEFDDDSDARQGYEAAFVRRSDFNDDIEQLERELVFEHGIYLNLFSWKADIKEGHTPFHIGTAPAERRDPRTDPDH